MVLNNAGRMLETVWHEIPEYYSGIGLDAFQIMPNHIHKIIIIVGAAPCGRPDMAQPPRQQPGRQQGQPRGVAPTGMSLPDVIHRFKTMTTKRYADGVKQRTWPRFDGKLWQRNYYEHIIRNETELNRIRQYIIDNPIKWPLDRNYPGDDSQQIHESTEPYEEKPWMI